jgi:hypothetical protein
MSKTKVAFSRSGETCIFGKCTAELPKVRVPDETAEIIRRKAIDSGYTSVTEYLKQLILINAYGIDTVTRLQKERLEMVAKSGEEKGTF